MAWMEGENFQFCDFDIHDIHSLSVGSEALRVAVIVALVAISWWWLHWGCIFPHRLCWTIPVERVSAALCNFFWPSNKYHIGDYYTFLNSISSLRLGLDYRSVCWSWIKTSQNISCQRQVVLIILMKQRLSLCCVDLMFISGDYSTPDDHKSCVLNSIYHINIA